MQSTQLMKMVSIGRSAQGRDINMIILSSDNAFNAEGIRSSSKPTVLIQGGIHAGEIDGKDAGLMLLRDILHGNKRTLIEGVNILFIPILNVDGHERSGPYNRVNQRGPENQGWRSNARNLNLNRDYAKIDTEEIRAVVKVMNEYDPDLYLDLHVTDGADYQYDITYGFGETPSRATSVWLKNVLTPFVDQQLAAAGHIPGQLVFSANDMDFTNGMQEFPYSPRFSNGYGEARHLPAVLVENHSLKPFRQRVLGTYVFLESVLSLIGREGKSLQNAIAEDQKKRAAIVLTYKRNPKADSVDFLGIQSERKKSPLTGAEFVSWTGKPIKQRIAYVRNNIPDKTTQRPKMILVPSTYPEVIERLKTHGIKLEELKDTTTVNLTLFKINDFRFSPRPVEGHFTVSGNASPFQTQEKYYPGSVRINLDQPLGDLAVHLLHPDSPDSFLQWGFFMEIFSRTEYMEQYVTEPLAQQMMTKDPSLKDAFEKRKKEDPDFASSPQKMYEWFYERSPYYDVRWRVYPVGFEF